MSNFPTSHQPPRFAKDLTHDERMELLMLVCEAIELVEKVSQAAPVERADLHQRTIKAKADAYRPYTLKDARPHARNAALRLRKAWDIIDPPLTGREA